MTSTDEDRPAAAGISVLHVIVRAGPTNSQYNEHCLPVMQERDLTVCSLFPAEVDPPPEIRLVEGDGSVRGCFRALRRALAAASYDVVHVHAPASGILTILVYLASFRSRRDLVFTVHSSWQVFRPRNRLFLVAIAAYFPVLVVCGEAAAESLPRFVRRWPRRVVVIPNGVDVERVDRVIAERPGPARRRDRRHGRDHVDIASIIRTRPVKDPGTLVEAFLAASRPRDSLVLVGAPSLPDEAEAVLRRNPRRNRVRLTGVVPRDEVYRIFDNAAFFVSSSTGEGLPVSVLEAMACRCPVVLSDIPPHREIAGHAPGIPLVPVGDVAGFRRAIRDMLTMSPAKRRTLGRAQRRCVLEGYSVAAMNAAYGRVYAGVVARNRSHRSHRRHVPARRTVRVAMSAVSATALGAVAGLVYGVSHTASYEASATILVDDPETLDTTTSTGLGEHDSAVVADVVSRQVVLQPAARALSVDDWRSLRGDVQGTVGSDPTTVVVTARAADAPGAQQLLSAVTDRVVQLSGRVSGPTPDPRFADQELLRLDGQISDTQRRIDRVLRRMGSGGPPEAGGLGRRLAVLQDRVSSQQASYQGMLAWPANEIRSRKVSVVGVAPAHRPAWPPQQPELVALGAVAGLAGLVGLLVLLRRPSLRSPR